ncbi:major facilitator superfamily domain-containing protein [Coniella lustricola]|uniref:Major facilitator superfamily domain-containing protein n=1 Tax=Coniella lustricola TaxID=2025994 RepID=A0A2T3A2Z1_9PEZI|nr:major facilitator superfamily domain-containing protein [Coniella lustricola]
MAIMAPSPLMADLEKKPRRKDVDGDGDGSGSEGSGTIVVQEVPKRTWRSYLWDTFDKSPEERKFLFKLDAVILTFASLGYFIKYLDQVNISNAYVSGMKEDMNLYGNQLNIMTTCWTVGYVIGEIPTNMLLTKVRPSYVIPACETLWAILTILMTQCKTAQQMYVLRFFIGLAESGFYPGMQYIIGSWYRKDELARRSCIFHASSAIGSMFSGYLMAAVYHLGGVDGFQGWQWLFIINTVISLPIAIAGFFLFPDVPEICRAFYLSKEEIALAQKRMQIEGRANRGKYTKQKVKKIFSSWHIYLLTLLYVLFNNGNGYGSQPVFADWLKDRGYNTIQVNTYPTITQAVQVITTFIYAWTSDTVFRGARWPPIVYSGVNNFVINVSMAIWTIPVGWKWACFILQGFGGGISGLIMAWAHEICSDDNEERALVVGSMNEMAYVFQAWLPNVIWEETSAPEFHKGFMTMIFVAVAMICTAFVVRFLHHRERASKMRGAVDVY